MNRFHSRNLLFILFSFGIQLLEKSVDLIDNSLTRFIKFFFCDKMDTKKKVLIYGSKGALGSAIVSHFKSQNWVSRQFIKVLPFTFEFATFLSGPESD